MFDPNSEFQNTISKSIEVELILSIYLSIYSELWEVWCGISSEQEYLNNGNFKFPAISS